MILSFEFVQTRTLSAVNKLINRRFMETVVPVHRKTFGLNSVWFLSSSIVLLFVFQHQALDPRITGFADARSFRPNVTLLKLGNNVFMFSFQECFNHFVDNGHWSGLSFFLPWCLSNSDSEAILQKLTDESEAFGADESRTETRVKDELISGLLASGFDETSCLSRHRSILYRKPSPYRPSSHLVSKLRSYENRHKLCGPNTLSYNASLKLLDSSDGVPATPTYCKYVIWTSLSGLGNKVLSLASTFLYALLTDRVLLVDRGKDMDSLFCEPFPYTSWFLPRDFALAAQFKSFGQRSAYCYGNMVKKKMLNNGSSTNFVPPYSYLHLVHDYDDRDKLFFCDEDQEFLKKVPWLVVRSNTYFIPSIFLMPSFKQELSKLFPSKDTTFHHLGRYLFHPSNQVWGLITRFYDAYMAKADERVGIQIRSFEAADAGPLKHVMDQILACVQGEKLLPSVDSKQTITGPKSNPKMKAVVMTSLVNGYFENLKNMYWVHPSVTGEVIGVYQPSHEKYQQSEKKMHNMKAWAEIYLLSLTDVLVTSGWSTFGYVAQGLGGLKPWILYRPENQTTPNPACGQAVSMEPCFHAPPFYDCREKRGADTGNMVPYVRHCEDVSWGLKVVDEF